MASQTLIVEEMEFSEPTFSANDSNDGTCMETTAKADVMDMNSSDEVEYKCEVCSKGFKTSSTYSKIIA